MKTRGWDSCDLHKCMLAWQEHENMQGICFQPWEKLWWHNYFTSENKGRTCENQIVELWERALCLVCPSASTIMSLSCTGFHYRTKKMVQDCDHVFGPSTTFQRRKGFICESRCQCKWVIRLHAFRLRRFVCRLKLKRAWRAFSLRGV